SAPLVCAICALPAAVFADDSRMVQTIGLTLLSVGFSFLVANAIVQKPEQRAAKLICAGLARLGVYSYSIYLWHVCFALIFVNWLRHSGMAFLILTSAAIGFGIMMSNLIEMPILRLRERFFSNTLQTDARQPTWNRSSYLCSEREWKEGPPRPRLSAL